MNKSIQVKTASSNYELVINQALINNYNFKWLVESKQVLVIKDSNVPKEFLDDLKINLSKSNPSKLISIEIKTNEKNNTG